MSIPRKIKFGVIGCSRVAQKGVMPAICDSNFAELGMVGSRSSEKAKSVAAQFNCDNFGTYDDVLKNREIDVVYVSLPNSLHEEWSIKATDAGRHVLCEKPAAVSYAAAKRMVGAAARNNVRLMEGYMFCYHPQHDRVKEMIKSGLVGNLLRFDGCFSYPMPPEGSSLLNKNLGGGSLCASGGYPVYASRMIFGEEPESVFCDLEIDPESGVDTKTDIFLRYPGGKSALLSSVFGPYFQSTYGVLGTRAYLKAARAYAVPRDMATRLFLDSDDKVTEIEVEPSDHFRLMVDDFCEEILRGKESRKDYEGDLLNQARVLEAARKSFAEKRIIRVSEIQ